MKSKSFAAFAAWFAFTAGIAGLLYSVAFVILQNATLSGWFLLLGGLCSLVAWTGLFDMLRKTESPYPLLAFILSAGAAAGSVIHGGYDLANGLHPPANLNTDLPNPVDPRGLLTFGVGAFGLFVFAWVAGKDQEFPRRLVYVGYASAALMLILYLGRLIILQAASPAIVIPALLEGFILNPLWFIWLGAIFYRMSR